ncbi:tyrosine-protein phosphatase [Neomicrococcus lactis]|uniref:Protein-tyrosine phosphatase n=1 Tax=Neomicrococcus lactis TaxID=732241 RepID=A0A7W8Y8L3_9MICC|nr:tyrosine-protein phosphatase [Neomicrococcus lactis]MBB5596949.1 protein-tyrosine phosphatase [Neomicrococcus lactis]
MHTADLTSQPLPAARPRWDGAVNARHIVGQIYGMGRREWLTQRGWQDLEDDAVATVIDLRNFSESGKRATDPVGEAPAGITVVHVPLEDPSHPDFERVTVYGSLGVRADGAPEPSIPYLHHPAGYPAYVELFAANITTALRMIAVSPSGGVVLHCSAGRDRTSLLATFLLDLAGKREEIPAAYAAGAHGINEYHRVSTVPHPYERYAEPERFEMELADRLEALAEFVATLDAQKFLQENGFKESEIERLFRKVRVEE